MRTEYQLQLNNDHNFRTHRHYIDYRSGRDILPIADVAFAGATERFGLSVHMSAVHGLLGGLAWRYGPRGCFRGSALRRGGEPARHAGGSDDITVESVDDGSLVGQ